MIMMMLMVIIIIVIIMTIKIMMIKIILIITVVIINSPFQPSDFSTGSTTGKSTMYIGIDVIPRPFCSPPSFTIVLIQRH